MHAIFGFGRGSTCAFHFEHCTQAAPRCGTVPFLTHHLLRKRDVVKDREARSKIMNTHKVDSCRHQGEIRAC